ncbi:histidine kinase [Pseudonocardia nematodicida]|uniref:histidine kinase n=1 Tax=Pseudonocardia nematodicida TaxID=1206997 RepID=A0ABV1K5P9_9PSEU
MTPGGPRPLPGSRAGDLALAALALLLVAQETMGTVLGIVPAAGGLLSGPAAVLLAVLLTLAMSATMLVRRHRPLTTYLGFAALASVSLATLTSIAALVWPILAFSVARAPRRGTAAAVAWVAGPYLVAMLAAVALRSPEPGGLADRTGLVAGVSLMVVPLLVIATVAGRWSRTAALRADRERAETDRLRRAAALDSERARIAEEIGGGVLAELRRLVRQAGRLGPGDGAEPELRAVRDLARSVLAAMRRVLGVLRAPSDDGPPDARPAPPPAPRERRRAGTPPLPDRAGVAALAAFGVPGLLFGLLFARVPRVGTGQPLIDGFLDLLRLPFGAPVAMVVVAVQFALIAWWRTAPLTALVLAGAGSFVAGGLDASNMFAEAGWTLLVWGAATRAPVRWSAIAVVVSTGAVALGGTLHGAWAQLGQPAPLVALSFLAVVPLWAAGVAVRRHRLDTDARRRALAEAGDRDALARERLRVARELHDVVAHHVSAIAVQAGAARLAADPAQRAEALAHIVEAARRVDEALPELAALTPDTRGADLSPAAVDALVAPSRTAGLPVVSDVVGARPDRPGEADLFAGRIVTEALTNTLRHAGPTPTRVRVEHRADDVVVEITDDGPVTGHLPDGAGSGLGLVGMGERVALLGGDLHAGPGDGHGWTVRAVLPRSPLVRADEGPSAAISSSVPIRETPHVP